MPLLTIPDDLSTYKAKAEKLVRALLKGKEDEAFKLMSKPLQDKFSSGELAQQCKNFTSNGVLKDVEFVKEFIDEKDKEMVIFIFKCSIGEQVVPAHVTFEFHGLKSYLIAYQIPSSKAKL